MRVNRNQAVSQGMFGKSVNDERVIHKGSTDPNKTTYNDLQPAVAVAAKDFLGKLRGGQGLDRTLDAASGASTTHYDGPAIGQKINRNALVGSKDLGEMGAGNVQKAERVSQRAACAHHCVRPGRTNCPYCFGEGFASKSQREGDPSHNVNHSRHCMPELRKNNKV
jgi:hypothetical protein